MITNSLPDPTNASKVFTLHLTPEFTCDHCGGSCGHLYREPSNEKGRCLSCHLDWQEFLEKEAAFKLQVQTEEQHRWEAAGRLAELLREEDRAREAWEAEQAEDDAEAVWMEEGERRHDEEQNSDVEACFTCGID